MPNSNSARKRVRQNEKHRDANRAKKSAMRTQVKKVQEAVEAGDAALAREELPMAIKLTDKSAKTNTIHKNTAARLKSSLCKAVNEISKSS